MSTSTVGERFITRLVGVGRQLTSRLSHRRITPLAPPLTFTDSFGRSIEIRPYQDEDFDALTSMYTDFDPAHRAQGTPPIGATAVREWLTDILDGVNVIAFDRDRVVGHVCFVPDGTGRHELAIFVHQDYQSAGIGTNLLAVGMGQGQREGVGYVWLSVAAWKRRVQRLYGRAGFSVVNPMGTTYRMSRYL